MAEKTAEGLVLFAKSKLGTPYVYGAKGGVLTLAQVNTWASMYPNVYTASYVKKAKAFIGKPCTDCSGLISWYTGILRGSSNYADTASKKLPISQLTEDMIGWAVWHSGHIGVYIGNGYVIEAKGINYGTIMSKVTDGAWTHVLKLKDITYGTKPATKDGWQKENGIWRVYQNGTMLRSTWFLSGNHWYYLDDNGNLKTGWFWYEKYKSWYYLDENPNDDAIGKMLYSTIVRTGGKNYALDKEGRMITEGHTIRVKVGPDGALEMDTMEY